MKGRLGEALAGRHARFLRFLAVGALNTLFGYSAFALLFVVMQRRNEALTAATVLGVLFNFFTTGRLVFDNRSWRTLLPFGLSYAVALAFNMILLNLLVALGLGTLVAQAVSLPPVVMVSYLINAHLVFRARPTGSAEPRR